MTPARPRKNPEATQSIRERLFPSLETEPDISAFSPSRAVVRPCPPPLPEINAALQLSPGDNEPTHRKNPIRNGAAARSTGERRLRGPGAGERWRGWQVSRNSGARAGRTGGGTSKGGAEFATCSGDAQTLGASLKLFDPGGKVRPPSPRACN